MIRSIQPTVLKSSSIKTTILALKRRLTIKDMAACPTEELILSNSLAIRKQDLEKPPLLLENRLPLNPPSPQNFRCPGGFGYFLELKYIVRRIHLYLTSINVVGDSFHHFS